MIPSVGSSDAWDDRKHVGGAPSVHPWIKVMQAGRCPTAIQAGEDQKDAVRHGIGEIVGVFGKKGSLGVESARGPRVAAFDKVEEGGEPVEGEVGEEGEVSGGQIVKAGGALGGLGAGVLEAGAGEVFNGVLRGGVDVVFVGIVEVGDVGLAIGGGDVALVDGGPGMLEKKVKLGGVGGPGFGGFAIGSWVGALKGSERLRGVFCKSFGEGFGTSDGSDLWFQLPGCEHCKQGREGFEW